MMAALERLQSTRRVAALLLGLLVLTGCQLEVAVDVLVNPDGTGQITVVAVADAELVERVPDIADELVLDDVIAADWEVEGPTATADGGLMLTLRHDFQDADEATNLLRSLGPPFNSPDLRRGQNGDEANNTIRANLGLPDGFATFADDELVSAVGGVPFADAFTEGEFTPANSMTAVLRVQMPGEVIDEETNAEELDDGTLQWTVPFEDGQILEAGARTRQAPSEGREWARPLSTVALVALIAWVAFMTLFIGYVALARWRRARRYRRRTLPLAERRQL